MSTKTQKSNQKAPVATRRRMTDGEIARDCRLADPYRIYRRGELDADHKIPGGMVARLWKHNLKTNRGEQCYVLRVWDKRAGETRTILLQHSLGREGLWGSMTPIEEAAEIVSEGKRERTK